MVDKNLAVPVGVVPNWANDENLTDAGEPWDGTPSRIDPGAGKRALGNLPNERPDPQHANYRDHLIGEWLQYLSAIQPMNWLNTGETAEANGTCIVFDEGSGQWVIGGDNNWIDVTLDGVYFQGLAIGEVFSWAASKSLASSPVHTGARVLFGYGSADITPSLTELAGAFTTVVLPAVGSAAVHVGVWDPINSLWLCGGLENTAIAPVHAFWSAPTPLLVILKNVPAAMPAIPSALVAMVHGEAVGSTAGTPLALNVAMGIDVSGGLDMWTSTTGLAWTTAIAVGVDLTETPIDLVWCAKREAFFLVTDKSCYRSVDGINWTSLVTYATGTFGKLATDGALIISVSGTSARFSIDGGVTWGVVPIPDASDGSITGIAYSAQRGRFAVVREKVSPTPAPVSLSLAVGEATVGPDGARVPTTS